MTGLGSVVEVARDVVAAVCCALWFTLVSIARRFFPAQRKSLSGRTAVVTGAGHGMGREFALQLSRLGVDVICWDVNAETCSETARDINASSGSSKAWAFQCDVSDRQQVARAAAKSREAAITPISLLINNAGILEPCKPFLEQTPEQIRNLFAVNVFSQMWLVNEFVEDLAAAGVESHIMSMSSTAGLAGRPNMSTYCSTKYAINGFMEALYFELKDRCPNVRITTVYPFVVNTGLAKKPICRFSWLTPFTNPDEAVEVILDGMRRNERYIYVPRQLEVLFSVLHIVPFKVKLLLVDFLGCEVLRHED